MKPTRNIVKPSGMWTTKGKVWFQKNDDELLAEFDSLRNDDKDFKKQYKQNEFKAWKKDYNLK